MQEWYSVLCGLLAMVGLLAFVCLLMSIFIQINESGHKNHTHSPSRIFRDGLDDVLNELEDRCEKENNKMINNLDEAIEKYEHFAECETETARVLRNNGNEKDAKYYEETAENDKKIIAWLEELKVRREADRWIPVTERLPSDDEPYEMLCCDNHGEIMIGHPFADEDSECGYSAENEGCFMYECVAWKPLPKPYESEDKI